MRIFSLQGWELIRKSDEKDSSVMLMTRKEKKQLQQGKFLFEYDFICLFNFQGRRVEEEYIGI